MDEKPPHHRKDALEVDSMMVACMQNPTFSQSNPERKNTLKLFVNSTTSSRELTAPISIFRQALRPALIGKLLVTPHQE
jgi:hypothetical protein